MVDTEEWEYRSFKRNNYFHGKLMTTGDFQTEQDYFKWKSNLINKNLHGTGVVFGLEFKSFDFDNKVIRITKGLAIDPKGREIFVPSDNKYQVLGDYDVKTSNGLYICYKEFKSEKVTISLNNESCQFNRIEEKFELKWDSIPKSPKQEDSVLIAAIKLENNEYKADISKKEVIDSNFILGKHIKGIQDHLNDIGRGDRPINKINLKGPTKEGNFDISPIYHQGIQIKDTDTGIGIGIDDSSVRKINDKNAIEGNFKIDSSDGIKIDNEENGKISIRLKETSIRKINNKNAIEGNFKIDSSDGIKIDNEENGKIVMGLETHELTGSYLRHHALFCLKKTFRGIHEKYFGTYFNKSIERTEFPKCEPIEKNFYSLKEYMIYYMRNYKYVNFEPPDINKYLEIEQFNSIIRTVKTTTTPRDNNGNVLKKINLLPFWEELANCHVNNTSKIFGESIGCFLRFSMLYSDFYYDLPSNNWFKDCMKILNLHDLYTSMPFFMPP